MQYNIMGNEYELDNAINEVLDEAELMGYDINYVQDEIANIAELMGYDTENPELMGGLIRKIIDRIKKRRAEKQAAQSMAPMPSNQMPNQNQFTIGTPWGTGTFSRQGINFTNPQQQALQQQQKKSIIDQLKENPMYAIVPAGLIALMLWKKNN